MIEAWLRASETIRSGSAGDHGDDPGVAGEAGLEGERRLDVLEACELGLQLLVERHRPGDGPDRAGPGPETADRVEGGLDEPRVRVEPEVVVGRERDRLAAVDRDAGPVGAAHHPERPVEALGAHLREVVGEVPQRIGGRRAAHRGVLLAADGRLTPSAGRETAVAAGRLTLSSPGSPCRRRRSARRRTRRRARGTGTGG